MNAVLVIRRFATGQKTVEKRALAFREFEFQRTSGENMINIYVGNLSFQSTEDELRTLFASHGEVSNVSIITDRDSGRSKGFAFVEMPDAAAAKQAIDALNDQEIKGRKLRVNEAKPREERPRRPARPANNRW